MPRHAGIAAMVVALGTLGVADLQLEGTASTWTSVAALLLYVGAYQVLWYCVLVPCCHLVHGLQA